MSTTRFDLPHGRSPQRVDHYERVNAVSEVLNGTFKAALIEPQGL
ncbi:hypothetical protein ACFV0T_29470 [Streptomyces sp. NPDC059582]